MTYKICENCKYWAHPKNDHDYGVCSSDKFIYQGDIGKDLPLDLLTYGDYDGYSAFFETGSKFGCIHWVGK
ncbi:MAG: hypothetical protein HKP41_00400 [Desulfobacterales bacterium]|nr:hypothetical protein [Desulfobacterales bacterium]